MGLVYESLGRSLLLLLLPGLRNFPIVAIVTLKWKTFCGNTHPVARPLNSVEKAQTTGWHAKEVPHS